MTATIQAHPISEASRAANAAQGLDAANNLHAVGWSRSGPVAAMANLRLGAASNRVAFRDAYESGADAVFEAGFMIGTKQLSVKFMHSRVSTFVPDGGLGRIPVPVDIKAVYNAGGPTFQWTLPGLSHKPKPSRAQRRARLFRDRK